MKLSLVFELLLIFVLLAFAASRYVDSKYHQNTFVKATSHKHTKKALKNRQTTNKFCSCSSKICNCCREFNIPVVALQGPGCASLQYLQGDRLAISMSFGERILSNTTISGRKPKPICMQLPGGVSKFCGRVYNIEREGDDFKACLGLELRALKEVEASLRVSCFRFGARGLKVEAAQPLPVVNENNDEDEDEDDDEDDEDDSDYLFGDDYSVENDADSVDYTAFSVFDDDFVGGIFGDDADTDYSVDEPIKTSTTASSINKHTTKAVRKPIKAAFNGIRLPLKAVSKKPTIVKVASPQTTKAPIIAASTMTTVRTVMVPIVTIAPEKKPEPLVESTISNSISETQSYPVSFPPSLQHDSIAAVTAMLQTPPSEITDTNRTPLTSSIQEITKTTAKPASTISNKIELAESVEESAAITTLEKLGTTEVPSSTVRASDNGKTDIAPKRPLSDNEKDDEDDEDDDNDDEDDNDSDPISSSIEEAIDDDDDEELANKTVKTSFIKAPNTTIENKTESQDVIDDIVEGVVETITGEQESSESHSSKPSSDDVDDDDDDDDLARKSGDKPKSRTIRIKKMWFNWPQFV